MDGPGAGIRIASRRVAIPKDVPFLIPAWLPVTCLPGAGLTQTFIQFSAGTLSSELIRSSCTRPKPLPELPELIQLLEACGELCDHTQQASALQGLSILPVQRAASVALEAYFASLPGTTRDLLDRALQGTHPIQRLAQEISLTPLSPWTVDLMAKRAHCSREHLSRLFRKHLHQSPSRFLREQRLMMAASMLCQSRDSMEQIAEACHFSDRFSFSKAFSKQYRCSPARFRNQSS